MSLEIVILAAGLGSRMRSSLPKVLHPLAHQPLLAHVLETARSLNPTRIHVVYGHGANQVHDYFAAQPDIHWVLQAPVAGTGHALQCALPHLNPVSQVLVLYGDVPLITTATLQQVLQQTADLTLLTARVDDPRGFGRVLRDADSQVLQIIEDKDADPLQQQITEIYSGILSARTSQLQHWLPQLDNRNAQAEYYLTDIVALAATNRCNIHCVRAQQAIEISGINDKMQLATAERYYQQRQVQALLLQGVTCKDPSRLDIRGVLRVGKDVTLDSNVLIEGEVSLGNGVSIEANVILRNVTIADNVHVKAFSLIEGASIAANCHIGPFARIRPGTQLEHSVRVGNFVEIKKSHIAAHSKVNHLSYIGDATLGSHVNVGAGTITCNYDGVNKYQTVIQDGAFIGSNVSLIAPLTIGSGATVGAGSVISKDAPAAQLTLTRAPQKTLPHWHAPHKAESE